MKRNASLSRKAAEFPRAWREAKYAALWANVTDICDDRVSDDIFDVEDEHAEVEIIARRMIHGAN